MFNKTYAYERTVSAPVVGFGMVGGVSFANAADLEGAAAQTLKNVYFPR